MVSPKLHRLDSFINESFRHDHRLGDEGINREYPPKLHGIKNQDTFTDQYHRYFKEMIASRLREQKAVDLWQKMDYKSFPLSS